VKKWTLLGVASILSFSAMTATAHEDMKALSNEGRALAKQFLGQLKPELKKAMKAGGPLVALEVCQTKAPEIAKKVAQDSGWQVNRVSLKPRNPSAKPDAFEEKVLKQFEQDRKAGKDPKKLEYAEKVMENGQPVFRYMKAIPTGDVCLTCHGTNLAPKVAQKIKQLYPNDQAIGFNKGDIRGAFSFKKSL